MTQIDKETVERLASWGEMLHHDRPEFKMARTLHALRAALEAKDAEIARLREALEMVMIGGNDLVTQLPVDHPPPDTPPLEALQYLGAGAGYDVWCCWSAIMRARAALRETEHTTHHDAQ
jgi:citrate lyase beta subunit